MANITVDLTEKACSYVEALYSVRKGIVEDCERVLAVCQTYMYDVEVAATSEEVKNIYSCASNDLKAIRDALRALNLEIIDGSVFSDSWPSNFNRIRRAIQSYEECPNSSTEVFRAVMSAFGFIYSYDKEAGVIIRYTSRPEER